MYGQIARDFANCPPPKQIELDEIYFYYDLLVPELIKYQQEAMKSK